MMEMGLLLALLAAKSKAASKIMTKLPDITLQKSKVMGDISIKKSSNNYIPNTDIVAYNMHNFTALMGKYNFKIEPAGPDTYINKHSGVVPTYGDITLGVNDLEIMHTPVVCLTNYIPSNAVICNVNTDKYGNNTMKIFNDKGEVLETVKRKVGQKLSSDLRGKVFAQKLDVENKINTFSTKFAESMGTYYMYATAMSDEWGGNIFGLENALSKKRHIGDKIPQIVVEIAANIIAFAGGKAISGQLSGSAEKLALVSLALATKAFKFNGQGLSYLDLKNAALNFSKEIAIEIFDAVPINDIYSNVCGIMTRNFNRMESKFYKAYATVFAPIHSELQKYMGKLNKAAISQYTNILHSGALLDDFQTVINSTLRTKMKDSLFNQCNELKNDALTIARDNPIFSNTLVKQANTQLEKCAGIIEQIKNGHEVYQMLNFVEFANPVYELNDYLINLSYNEDVPYRDCIMIINR